MSVGRPDPNAFKVITPDVYNQNLVGIARAKATLEAFEKMNEAGKSNYEKLAEQEERELEQKIQEGLLAKQRLQQLRQQKASGLLEDGRGTSRIEEVGITNPRGYESAQRPQHPPTGQVSVGPPFQSTSQFQANQPLTNNPNYNGQAMSSNQTYAYPQHYVYFQPTEQLTRQTSSASYSGGSSYPTAPSQPLQQTHVNQRHFPPSIPGQINNGQGQSTTSNANQHQRPQTQGVPSVHHQPPTQTNAAYYRNPATTSQKLPQGPPIPPLVPHMQPQSYSQLHYRQQPPISTGTSSLVGALGAVTSPNLQTSATSSNNSTSAPAMVLSGSSHMPPIASSSRPALPGNGPSLSKQTAEPASKKDPVVSIPSAPSRVQVTLIKNYFSQWASRVPPQTEYTGDITCGKYSIKCSKHSDGSLRFLINLPTGLVHMLAGKFLDGLLSTASQPIDHSPLQQHATTPQVVSNTNLPRPSVQGPAPNDLPDSTSQQQVASLLVADVHNTVPLSTHSSQVLIPSHQTPTKRAPLERRIGTITSPQQADKKRIAQSVLFALGKRRRENDSVSDAESHTSKKQTIETRTHEKSEDPRVNLEPSKEVNPVMAAPHNTAVTNVSTTPLQPKSTNEIPVNPPPSTQVSAHPSQTLPQNVAKIIRAAPTGPNSSVSMSLPQPFTQPASTNPAPAPQHMQYAPINSIQPSNLGNPQTAPTALTALGPLPVQAMSRNVTDVSQTTPASQLAGPSSSQIPISQISEKASSPLVLRQTPTSLSSSSSIPPPVSGNVESSSKLNAPNTEHPVTIATPALSQANSASQHSQQAPFPVPTNLGPSTYRELFTNSSVTVVQKPDHVSVPTTSSATVSTQSKTQPSAPATVNPSKNLIPQITYMKTASKRPPEPVASTSKLAPPKEPLFLPSSPSAESDAHLQPWGSENGGEHGEFANESSKSKAMKIKKNQARWKMNNAYVLVPPAPEYLVRYRQQKNKRKESGRFSSSAVLQRKGTRTDSSVSTSVVREEDFSRSFESQPSSSNEEKEREAIKLACSRLQVAPCRWDGCDAKMNSIEALICHLNVHKPAPSQHTNTFMCRWTQCGQQGIKPEDIHVEKHALLPLRCAYAGCDDSFRSGGQLLRHFRAKHLDDELKPSAKPAAPSTLLALPPIPGVIPSYLIVTSLAGREVLSKDRHNSISSQILRNMTFSEQTAPSRQRSRKNARPANRLVLLAATGDLTNDYQFLENNNSARASTYFSKACDLDHADLDSQNVSKMIDQGVVLLGSDDSGGREDDDDRLSPSSPLFSPLQRRVSHGKIKVEQGWEEEPSYGGSASHHDEHSSDEHAAVETMLTDMTPTRTSIA